MDPEVSLMLHCAPLRGLREHQVQVTVATRFNRQNVPEIEKHIQAVWDERVTKEPWLFNGAKFRLHSATLTIPHTSSKCLQGAGDTSGENCDSHFKTVKDMEVEAEESSMCLSSVACQKTEHGMHRNETPGPGSSEFLHLELGLTFYKDFIGTNWSKGAEELRCRGRNEFGDSQALLAQPLGVGAVMATSDGRVVLLRRSQRVAEARGLLDIPGGHPEPKAVCKGVNEETITVEMLLGRERAIVTEIFSSVCAEIRDEVNVPLEYLSEPVLMGIALNHTSAGRPSAEFFIRCSLTAEKVKDFYCRGGPEAHESTDIVFLTRNEILQLGLSTPLWSELCPSAKGAVMLYRQVIPDEGDI
ncbi:uridine diphosphate glucose pyrophosphatase NUDT22 [Chanos chanos]|uniref:Uridine diphosphate glucose pyrophosphatase NUDT22 n=1 Tax=Chanos chanos TaxID=29144 RepID=A0A6J2UQF4_CHACN|nr:uridine diphosphate glucose pyrophosphatase NUDT22 [Chanos chanos]